MLIIIITKNAIIFILNIYFMYLFMFIYRKIVIDIEILGVTDTLEQIKYEIKFISKI